VAGLQATEIELTVVEVTWKFPGVVGAVVSPGAPHADVPTVMNEADERFPAASYALTASL